MEAREHSTASFPETLPVLKIQDTLTGTLNIVRGSECLFPLALAKPTLTHSRQMHHKPELP